MFLRHLLSILLLPITMTVVVPYLILPADHARHFFVSEPPGAIRFLGACITATGVALAGWTIWLFATIGRGTLAPWDPPEKFVVAGPYRHLRNPMISGILCILAGETPVFQSAGLLVWFAFFFTVNSTYIPLFEEPSLERRFGNEYLEYKRNVPRWIPRREGWQPPGNQ